MKNGSKVLTTFRGIKHTSFMIVTTLTATKPQSALVSFPNLWNVEVVSVHFAFGTSDEHFSFYMVQLILISGTSWDIDSTCECVTSDNLEGHDKTFLWEKCFWHSWLKSELQLKMCTDLKYFNVHYVLANICARIWFLSVLGSCRKLLAS